MQSASVYSVYMSNISNDVISCQKKVVDLFLPEGWEFKQFLYEPKEGEDFHHASALTKCLAESKSPITVFLDIDCIPLNQDAFLLLAKQAENGALVGGVQRANHLNNNAHLYVGPYCMAFLNSQYKKMGSPSFKETDRGDCAEELTYKWEEAGQPLYFLYPTDIFQTMWELTEGKKFGLGTTYEGLFYHAFSIRQGMMQEQFIAKCNEVLQANPPRIQNEKKTQVLTDQEIKPRKVSSKENEAAKVPSR